MPGGLRLPGEGEENRDFSKGEEKVKYLRFTRVVSLEEGAHHASFTAEIMEEEHYVSYLYIILRFHEVTIIITIMSFH